MLNIPLPYDPAITIILLEVYPKEEKSCLHKNYTYKKYLTGMLVTALFILAQMEKQPTCPSVNEHINRMWNIQIMDYYLATKRNELLILASTWMNLRNIYVK